MRRWLPHAVLAAIGLLAAVALLVALNLRGESSGAAPPAFASTSERVQRGAYLARAGNCVACHTMRGGEPYAGGRAIETPFGTVYGTNITPDPQTGIGDWSADDFWRALHHGRARDGRLLLPAFPYPHYTRVTREDADALYAWLRTLPPVERPNRPHALRFPYGTQPALAVWRALYFRPGVHADDPGRSPEWNRGSYLVQGLGHCGACHGTRNALGALRDALPLSGGVDPVDKWYAPSLTARDEAGVMDWPVEDIVALLRDGVSARGSALGPMAEVVFRSTQHLDARDLRAMATFLQSLPATENPDARRTEADAAALARGGALYRTHCEGCHGPQGEGARGAYPPLAGNRAVVMRNSANAIRAVLSGGFQPATAGNPRPWGMPPFGHVLGDGQIADVLTYVRNAWGNRAGAVTALDVQRLR